MAKNFNLPDLINSLKDLSSSKDINRIVDGLSENFATETETILSDWRSQSDFDAKKIKYLDLISQLEFRVVEEYLSMQNEGHENKSNVNKLRRCLFRTKQIDSLKDSVIFIRDDDKCNDQDIVLSYITRMLDARTLYYRLCWDPLQSHPKELNSELIHCLKHRRAKNCFDQLVLPKLSLKVSKYQREFFIGCCTLAVALYLENKESLKSPDDDKLIYRLAKYVRIILNDTNFHQDPTNIYCLRGIFAILNNCVPTKHWLDIINKALSTQEKTFQRQNPFNEDLFRCIVDNLFGSKEIQSKAITSSISNEALLVDVVFIFLYKWCYTSEIDADEYNNPTDLNSSQRLNSDQQTSNEIVAYLRSSGNHDDVKTRAMNIYAYVKAKYDRIRLMAFATLVNVMDYEIFQSIAHSDLHAARDLVSLIFDFIEKADIARPRREYKGITFELLLRFLLRFTVQDFIKKEVIHYLPKLIKYAENREIYALKVIRRISLDTNLRIELSKNKDLDTYLNVTVIDIVAVDRKIKETVEQIKENLIEMKPEEQKTKAESKKRQAFISYCRKDQKLREKFVEILRQQNIFDHIWVDTESLIGSMIESITSAINESEVVFILVSENYCKSDICRREWVYTFGRKIKFFVIFLEETFKKNMYDWVDFLIGHENYYRLRDDTMKKLTAELLSLREKKPLIKAVTSQDKEISISPTLQQRHKINEWDSHDIECWCTENKFEAFKPMLKEYDGSILIQLHEQLKSETSFSKFADADGIIFTEALRFRTKLSQLVEN